uniref:Large ribosomal subunit protein mL40 n=1 Tax=Hirondellea gigas TaxID=1518452 RepID=A0A2P2I0F7_9CRUS
MSIVHGLLGSLLRCSTSSISSIGRRCISTNGGPLYMQLTPVLCAEPLKKKRKVDPGVVRARDEKRKKKIEKSIRKLARNEGIYKPIEETEVSLKLRQEYQLRKRDRVVVSEEERDAGYELGVQWCQYKFQQSVADKAVVDAAVKAQQHALVELRRLSEDLWLEAIQEDQFVFPYRCSGPSSSLPMAGYKSPDGDYKDVSKVWD